MDNIALQLRIITHCIQRSFARDNN